MTRKNKHLTFEDRLEIQAGIKRQETFRSMDAKIDKDPTTISKEVKRNRQVRDSTCNNLPCPLLGKSPQTIHNEIKRGTVLQCLGKGRFKKCILLIMLNNFMKPIGRVL